MPYTFTKTAHLLKSTLLRVPLLVLLSLAPVVGAQTPTTFDWKLPAQAVVVEEVEKVGQDATLQYRISLRSAQDSDELVLHFSDFSFIAIGGAEVTPEMSDALKPSLAMASALPDLVLNKKGQPQRISGYEDTIKRVRELLGEIQDISETEIQQAIALLNSPETKAHIQGLMFDVWNTWVGHWIDFSVKAGKKKKDKVDVPAMTGKNLKAKRVRQHHGATQSPSGHIRLSVTTTLSGRRAARALQTIIDQGEKEIHAPTKKHRVKQFKRTLWKTVITEAAGLRPMTAEMSDTRRLKLRGSEATEELERHRYQFTWVPTP